MWQEIAHNTDTQITFVGLPNTRSYNDAMAHPVYLGPRYLISVLRKQGFKANLINVFLNAEDLCKFFFAIDPEVVEEEIAGIATEKALQVLSPVINELAQKKCRCVLGFSTSWHHIKIVLKVIKAIKQKYSYVTILLGGVYATLTAEKVMMQNPEIDYILAGEAELTVGPFLHALEEPKGLATVGGLIYRSKTGEIRVNKAPKVISNLEKLPIFDLEDIISIYRRNGDFIRFSATRGCYGRCTFCSINAFSQYIKCPQPRFLTAQTLVDQIEYLNKQYGLKRFVFVDPNFLVSGKSGRYRGNQIANEIINRNLQIKFKIDLRANEVDRTTLLHLKKAGLYGVEMGIESFDKDTLLLLNKKTTTRQNLRALKCVSQLGLISTVSYIFYVPWLNEKTILRTLKLIKRVSNMPGITWFPLFKELKAMPGTKLHKQMQADGLNNDANATGCVINEAKIEVIRQQHMAFCNSLHCFLQNIPFDYIIKDNNIPTYTQLSKIFEKLSICFLEALIECDQQKADACCAEFGICKKIFERTCII